jgi:hypothetical protein
MFPGGAVSSLNTPPTPFADRESLEAELKALEKDIDHIQQLKVCMVILIVKNSGEGYKISLLLAIE